MSFGADQQHQQRMRAAASPSAVPSLVSDVNAGAPVTSLVGDVAQTLPSRAPMPVHPMAPAAPMAPVATGFTRAPMSGMPSDLATRPATVALPGLINDAMNAGPGGVNILDLIRRVAAGGR